MDSRAVVVLIATLWEQFGALDYGFDVETVHATVTNCWGLLERVARKPGSVIRIGINYPC